MTKKAKTMSVTSRDIYTSLSHVTNCNTFSGPSPNGDWTASKQSNFIVMEVWVEV